MRDLAREKEGGANMAVSEHQERFRELFSFMAVLLGWVFDQHVPYLDGDE
jgi:hypothetical protein